jgi:trehalose 6-phosphate phosphatase
MFAFPLACHSQLAMDPNLPAHAALFLDLDGTLLDIAPTPDSVVVPPGLPPSLRALRRRLGDALAVVTGRPVEQIDSLLGDIPFAVAGEHGGAIRHEPGGAIEQAALPGVPEEWMERARQAVAHHPGALFEGKARGFVLHYRLAPQAGEALREALRSILDGARDRYTVLPAHMAWEVKARGVDKGTAVVSLLARPPFAGRVPVYVGDDVTDEDGMRAARDAGGFGLRVPDVFANASGVRAWLVKLATEFDPGLA